MQIERIPTSGKEHNPISFFTKIVYRWEIRQ